MSDVAFTDPSATVREWATDAPEEMQPALLALADSIDAKVKECEEALKQAEGNVLEPVAELLHTHQGFTEVAPELFAVLGATQRIITRCKEAEADRTALREQLDVERADRQALCELSAIYGEPLDHNCPNPARVLELARQSNKAARAEVAAANARGCALQVERDAMAEAFAGVLKAIERASGNDLVRLAVQTLGAA